jgi:GWxTD domain-containing protein
LALGSWRVAGAQFPELMEARWFTAEAQAGIDSTGAPVVTVSVNLPHRQLVFFRDGEVYVCGYRLRVVHHLYGRALDSQEWTGTIQVASYDLTRGQASERRIVQVRLPPELAVWMTSEVDGEGKGRPGASLEVTVEIDGTERVGRRQLPLEQGLAPRQGIALAEPALYALRDAASASAWPQEGLMVVPVDAFPDSRQVVPRQGNSYDLATGPVFVLLTIFDLRAPAAADSHRVRMAVVPQGKSEVRWSASIALPAGGSTVRALVRLPLGALAFGSNDLRLELDAAVPRQVRLENYGLDVGDDASWEANVELIASLARDDAERDRLRSAAPQERAAVWAEFWRSRDPDPDEPGNPRLDTHYRRVEYSRRELRDGFHDGALSDRGRVYILHGPPDSIESRGMLQSSNAEFEVWEYYEAGVAYYFRDADGLGHFRLVWREQR